MSSSRRLRCSGVIGGRDGVEVAFEADVVMRMEILGVGRSVPRNGLKHSSRMR